MGIRDLVSTQGSLVGVSSIHHFYRIVNSQEERVRLDNAGL